MYLRRLHIRNLKLIEDLTLDFTRDGEPRGLTVLVGENGTCKTSVLQAIALAASGRAIAERVGGDIAASLPHIERTGEDVEVLAEFQMGPIGHDLGRWYPGREEGERPAGPPLVSAELKLPGGRKDFVYRSWYGAWGEPQWDGVDFLIDGQEGPIGAVRAERELVPHWFVVGYGVRRNLPVPGGAPAIRDPVDDRIRPLFGLREVTGTGFADALNSREEDDEEGTPGARERDSGQSGSAKRKKPSKGAAARLFADILNAALTEDEHLVPDIRGLERRGQGGAKSAAQLAASHRVVFTVDDEELKLPAVWLSAGYQSTLAWISDLIGWVLWEAREGVPPHEMEGIVLVDELDLHLHPTWQVSLPRALTQVFPNLQFITTTHSPAILAQLDDDEIIRLGTRRGRVVRVETGGSPRSSTATELLDDYFGIDRLITNPAGDDLWRYAEIATNPYRSDAEDAEMRRLLDRLKSAKIDPDLEPEPRITEEGA